MGAKGGQDGIGEFGEKSPRAAHKNRERALGYKTEPWVAVADDLVMRGCTQGAGGLGRACSGERKTLRSCPRNHPNTRKDGAHWGPR